MLSPEKTTITYPKHLSDSLALLQSRWLMTPNMLSDYLGSHLMRAAILPALSENFEKHTEENYQSIQRHIQPYTLALSENNDRQTLRAIAPGVKKYQVYLGGNMMDVLNPDFVKKVILKDSTQNHIFENYPGVSNSQTVHHLNPLIQAGYEQIKTLLNEDIPPQNITLYGISLGGGVATEIAKKLIDEGYPVNLKIHNSFSSLSAITSPLLHRQMQDKLDLKKQYGCYLPLATSIASCAILTGSAGIALGGLIKSIGVLAASLIANIGYYLSLGLAMVPGLALPASLLNEMFNTFASYLDKGIDLIASTVGALTTLVSFMAGVVIGAAVGVLLSLQLLVTNEPINMPLDFAASALLNTTTGEMNSTRNVQHILGFKRHGHISILNSKEDEIICPKAALNTGLGLLDNTERTLPKQGFGGNLLSMWSNNGHHNASIEDSDLDHTLTYIEPA